MLKIIDAVVLLLYCAFIFWLSSQNSFPQSDMFRFMDKFQHFGAYFMMGILAWYCIRHVAPSRAALVIASIAFCSLYGVSDEWHQSFVAGRSSDAWDWVADTLGASIATLVLAIFYRHRKLY